ncbi:hypothetical protein [Anabaena azotica]|uniref:Uncharacterized protein n=1 Tax=Anabaena azotica FACHB-119 TaxID=947527 RepID=A0ABR8DEJ2_9NOST|nr:hypothetical protein [Anabaena azotica]MBD2505381.1 hypothetical protein [Anabaena azotica FACHB-119]
MNTPPRKRKATSASSINPEISTEDPASATIDVAAVEVPELTAEEQSDRLHLERKVERAFFEAGKALSELRDRRLYRSTHRTFEEYCRDRFGHSRQKSNYLIAAAQVYENLTTNCCQNSEVEDLTTNGTQILPTSEGQVRPMTKLEPQEQQQAWQIAVEEAGGKAPSGRVVKDVVQRIMERTQVPNSYQIGEVCRILVKDNPELRGMGGCWGIVTYVGEFSCTVRTWNGELTVGVQHLKSCEYLPAECEQVGALCDGVPPSFADRISRVYSTKLEESVQKFLESPLEAESGLLDPVRGKSVEFVGS